MELQGRLQGLEWLIEEVEASLHQAYEALESYLADPSDEGQIRFCLSYLHQIHGSLKIAECHGPLLLAEEMEGLAASMLEKHDLNVTDACDVMVQAILKLPAYLRQVMISRRDQPETLLLLLNELRAVRGESLVSETVFFSPEMGAAYNLSAPYNRQPDPIAMDNLLRKLRQMYQFALAGVVKDETVGDNFGYLDKVFSRLKELSKGFPREPLWTAVLALLEGISAKEIPLSYSVKKLLQTLDVEIGQLAKMGFEGLAQPLPEALLKNILFYIAYAHSDEPRAKLVRSEYQLDESLPEALIADSGEGLSPIYHPDAAQAIVTALTQEISQVKEALDRYAMAGNDHHELLDEATNVLRRIRDSLAVLGRSDLRETMAGACDQVTAFRKNPSDSAKGCLMLVASQLLEVESSLYGWLENNRELMDGLTPPDEMQVEVTRAQGALLEEARKGLDTVKEAIVEFIASQWQRDKLDGVPEVIMNIRGALSMMHLPRAAIVLDSCNLFLVEQVLGEENVPSWNMLDALADAITSIEYYLEFVGKQDERAEEAILGLAEEGVTKLGYPVAASGYVQPVQIENVTAEEIVIGGPAVDEDDDFTDQEIIDIFLEEMGELEELIDSSYQQWATSPADENSLGDLRRCFHTVKGSSRMVKAQALGELGWAVENLLNKVIEKRIIVTPTLMALVDLSREELSGMTEAFRQKAVYERWDYVSGLISAADALAKGENPELPAVQTEEPADSLELKVEAPGVEEISAVGVSEVEEATTEPESVGLVVEDTSGQVALDDRDANNVSVDGDQHNEEEPAETASLETDHLEEQVLLDIFSTEAEGYLQAVQNFVDEQRREAPVYSPVNAVVQSALHTLKGSARMAAIDPIADLVTPLEHYTKELYTYQLDVDENIVELFSDAVNYCRGAIAPMKTVHRVGEIPELASFLARLEALRQHSVEPLMSGHSRPSGQSSVDPELLNLLMTEGMQSLLDVDVERLHWHQGSGDTTRLVQLRDELKQLATAASRAGVDVMSDLSLLLSTVYESIIECQLSLNEHDTQLLQQAHETLLGMVDCVAANQKLSPVPPLLADQLEVLAAEASEKALVDEKAGVTNISENYVEDTVVEAVSFNITEPPSIVIQPLNQDDIDLDILETFVSEADELLEEIDQALQGWERNWSSKDHVESLKRVLHTLKGGARMAGMEQLGSLSHDLESEVLLLETNREQLNKEIFNGLLRQQDDLLEVLGVARRLLDGDEAPRLDVALPEETGPAASAYSEAEPSTSGFVLESSVEDASSSTELIMKTVLPHVVDEAAETQFKPDSAALTMPQIKRQATSQEMIKVPAALLESLVNLAGETSIARGRVEQHVSEFSFTLDEMESTILRLKDQVRRIGMETEAQVMFRQEQLEAMSVAEGFDPLEMDRYSQLQQLSRSLLESSSDLQDLKNTLVDKSRGADSELLRQSRINTDLQEQLMQARMVPFFRIVPRLRRMVRQLSNELGKKVELFLANVEGEMDRSMMEQMLPPLEHMIRNSIDHGIESSEERLRAGKPEMGAISVGLHREGGDILIQLSDDGRGLNLESIRRRAIQLGLMSESSDLGDQEIIQFIFQPGFSTNEEVTQVSGRGVGMDVVNSQVRELGGFVQTVTRKGEGTQFSIRLPFTVSVNRALMIEIGEDRYALPLNSVDGVVRVSSMELEHYYRFPDARLEYAGGRYEVRYLGSLLSEELTPKVDMSVESVFLVLVHSETRLYAVQVDRLAGSSEIVVKSLGPQFSKVPGLSGATLLGDGRVVVILDLLALLRAQITAKPGVEVLDSRDDLSQSETPVVMVVDDSVTVRKVACRFLEREGFQVVTARDGIEAMKLLQESQPDIMLLDIEMPRMDGFEVARRVKANEELKHIPIIMITSRTGDKHRERAMNLGVEGYLGKPYQEEALLEAMSKFMGASEEPAE
ncbi:MAG: Hpt domain-containing protein [Porticoccus sp.]|nr:Hpt domain-containing protein [Porticoccus sp.]